MVGESLNHSNNKQPQKTSPFSKRRSQAVRRLPARTQTEVVPSPASISCALDSSTSYWEGQLSKIITLLIDNSVWLWLVSPIDTCDQLTIFAAGCITFIRLRMVAPSLVMVTSPAPDLIYKRYNEGKGVVCEMVCKRKRILSIHHKSCTSFLCVRF